MKYEFGACWTGIVIVMIAKTPTVEQSRRGEKSYGEKIGGIK